MLSVLTSQLSQNQKYVNMFQVGNVFQLWVSVYQRFWKVLIISGHQQKQASDWKHRHSAVNADR